MTLNPYFFHNMQVPYFGDQAVENDSEVKLPPISNILAASRVDTQPTVDSERFHQLSDQFDLCTTNLIPHKNVKFELNENSAQVKR